jgi:hypothetical protein
MTKHPCEGMTRSEITAFEAIAINRQPRCSKKTIDTLLARGVIAKEEKQVHLADGLPPSVVSDYYVPLPVHVQWCEWAAWKQRDRCST